MVPAQHSEQGRGEDDTVAHLGGWSGGPQERIGRQEQKCQLQLENDQNVALFWTNVLKMFGLVHIIMPLHARKSYPKPWLQHTRGSDGERSRKISAVKKTESLT